MPDTTTRTAPNVFALPVASLQKPLPVEGPGHETPRPGFTVVDELIRRLPAHLGATPRQMPYAGASLSVLLSLGSILEVHTSGFNILALPALAGFDTRIARMGKDFTEISPKNPCDPSNP